MPDETIPPVGEPENLPGLENQNTLPPAPAAENTVAEKIFGAAGRIFQKHGVKFRPGRGRPKKNGEPKISDVPLEAGGPSPADAVPPAPAAEFRSSSDKLTVKAIIAAAVKGVFQAVDKLIRGKAEKAGYAPPDVEKIVSQNAITPQEIDGFAELGLVLADYFKIETEKLAMGGAVVLVAGVSGRYGMTLVQLSREAAAQAKVEGGKK